MPLGSIQEWRARIGSSWCALGRPMKNRSFHSARRPRCQHSGRKVLSYQQFLSTNMLALLIPWIAVALLGSCDSQFRMDTFFPTGFFLSLFENINLETYIMIVESLINCLCSMLFNPFQEVSQLWIKTRDYQKLFSFEFIRTCMHAQWSAQRRADVSEFMTILAGPIVESQLLRSGDVESNPGPGRLPGIDYSSVNASDILGEDELIDIMDEIRSIRATYYSIGVALRLRSSDLKAIRQEHSGDDQQALTETLLLWLNQKYNVAKYGEPTWRMLVEAVDRESGGNDHELAKQIAFNHPQKFDDKLGIENLREMNDLAWSYRSKWKEIGIKLGIDVGTLDAIEKDYSKCNECLSEMNKTWLRGNKLLPYPTRSAMIMALKTLDDVSKSSTTDDNTLLDYHSYLKSLYNVQSSPSSFSHDHQWPPPATDKVFRLAMITAEQLIRRGSSVEDEVHVRQAVKGEVERILLQKVPIELKDIFLKTREKKKKILLEGAPGCGKSTLLLSICHQWTDEKLFHQYKLVILVRLREPGIQKAKCIADLLPRKDEAMGHDIAKVMKESNGKDVIFLLDGWDELSSNEPGHDVIQGLLEGRQLHECSIIITSRPISSANLYKVISTRVEILGFTTDELKEYFTSCLQDVRLAETLLRRIQQNPAVLSSCYLPLNASILVHLFKCADNVLPTTQYEIFSLMVSNCIFRHLRNAKDTKISGIESLDKLPQEVKGPFQRICEIAYKGVMENTVSFALEAGLNTLGLLRGVESFAICGMSHSYNFLHLSIQELLAAIHIATQLSASEQVAKFSELLGQSRFSAVFQFYAAKTKLRTPGISDIVMQVVGRCSKECHKIDDKNRLLPLINCLFEAQDSHLCQSVLEQLGSKLNLQDVSLNPSDCLSVGYFLTHTKRDYKVNLVNCSIGVEGCKALFTEDNKFHFIHLYFNYNSIGNEGALVISTALRTMTTLQELFLTHNSIGDEGAIALSDVFKTMVNLEVLDLSNNSLGDQGALAISMAMITMTNLRELNLGLNYIGDTGIAAIRDAGKVGMGIFGLGGQKKCS